MVGCKRRRGDEEGAGAGEGKEKMEEEGRDEEGKGRQGEFQRCMNLNPLELWEPPGKTALQALGQGMHFQWINRDENLGRMPGCAGSTLLVLSLLPDH